MLHAGLGRGGRGPGPVQGQARDTADPTLGMAQHYLLCPTNHATKTLDYLTLRDSRAITNLDSRRSGHTDDSI